MTKPNRWASALDAASNVVEMTQADAAAETHAEETKFQRSVMPLNKIKERHENTRSLNDTHVDDLCGSIADVGIIHPIAVDEHGRLLAGRHRLAAIQLLQSRDSNAFNKWFADGIPVMTITIGTGDEATHTALAIELSENEKRRDYTREEIRALAERLKHAGYRDVRGRPKEGQKPLAPALSLVLGKSLRTVQRLLADQPPAASKDPKQAAIATCTRAVAAYFRAVPRKPRSQTGRELYECLERLRKLLAEDPEK